MLLLFYFISIDVSWFIVFQTNHADYLVNQKNQVEECIILYISDLKVPHT